MKVVELLRPDFKAEVIGLGIVGDEYTAGT